MSTEYHLIPYKKCYLDQWEKFIEQSVNGVFFHKQKFLSYHQNKFVDQSLLVFDDKNNLKAIFPIAEHPNNSKFLISHPGITFGGLITNQKLRGSKILDLFQDIIYYFRKKDYYRIYYKSVPYIYHRIPMADDLYALFRLNAIRCRCDLSVTIDLLNRYKLNERRRRALKKSKNVDISDDTSQLACFWDILEQNLADKYSTKPVHNLTEIQLLIERFPENIKFIYASINDAVIGGVILFINYNVVHAQYIASNQEGYKFSALDKIFNYVIHDARQQGFRYFDFGICNEKDGRFLNQNLLNYKIEFGAGTTAYEFYEINLNEEI